MFTLAITVVCRGLKYHDMREQNDSTLSLTYNSLLSLIMDPLCSSKPVGIPPEGVRGSYTFPQQVLFNLPRYFQVELEL